MHEAERLPKHIFRQETGQYSSAISQIENGIKNGDRPVTLQGMLILAQNQDVTLEYLQKELKHAAELIHAVPVGKLRDGDGFQNRDLLPLHELKTLFLEAAEQPTKEDVLNMLLNIEAEPKEDA